jgi:flagellar FliJ protein
MARFRFRLATLKRLREAHRDELHARLAEAYEADRILAEQRAAVAADAAALALDRRRLSETGSVDVTRLLEAQRYQLSLEAQSRAMAEQAQRLAVEVESRRQAVVEADRDVRVLDRLRERRLAQHRHAEQAAEAKRFDEVAAARFRGGKL